MEKQLRSAIGTAAQNVRRLLEQEFLQQLEGTFDIHSAGLVAAEPGAHLSDAEKLTRLKIVSTLDYKRASGSGAAEAVGTFIREAAFTALNRFVALKMLEARGLIQECVSAGLESIGYREFTGLAKGVAMLQARAGYRLYLESIFDELATEVAVLFDRTDTSSLLWPRDLVIDAVLTELNKPDLALAWNDEETIGWFYQFFNSKEERQQMRDESQAPRNSRELVVRNQFFTPRYVVRFLVDNTLGRAWAEMVSGSTITDQCDYFVDLPDSQPARDLKDPRDFRVLDPACGSGHFLLYSYDVLAHMYREAWELDLVSDQESETPRSLRAAFHTREKLDRAMPQLILERNLYGVDIDPRAAQIAALAVWFRAQRAWLEAGVPHEQRPRIRRTNIVVAEPMPNAKELVSEFVGGMQPPVLGSLFRKMVEATRLAGEVGTLLRPERELASTITRAREEFAAQLSRPQTLPGLDVPTPDQGQFDLSGVTDDAFFLKADHLLMQSLHDYAAVAAGENGQRRRLFADDAGEGVALVELLRHEFDVVLMNPPFGEPVAGTFDWLRSNYEGFHNDIYVAFLRRAAELAPSGFVGAVTSRSFLMAPRLEPVRRELLAPRAILCLDLRQGVMDEAAVEAAALVLGSGAQESVTFLDGSDGRRVLPSLEKESLTRLPRFELARSGLTALHQARILYRLPTDLRHVMSERSFEPHFGTAREGPKTFDNARFLRLRWEVPRAANSAVGWIPFAKGGEYFFGVSPPHLAVNWRNDGSELRALNQSLNGSTSQVRQASKYWYREGVTYSKRSQRGFSARLLPAGTIFSSNGPAVLAETKGVTPGRILGWINSRPIRALLNLQSNFGDYSTGVIKKLPWPGELDDRMAPC